MTRKSVFGISLNFAPVEILQVLYDLIDEESDYAESMEEGHGRALLEAAWLLEHFIPEARRDYYKRKERERTVIQKIVARGLLQ